MFHKNFYGAVWIRLICPFLVASLSQGEGEKRRRESIKKCAILALQSGLLSKGQNGTFSSFVAPSQRTNSSPRLRQYTAHRHFPRLFPPRAKSGDNGSKSLEDICQDLGICKCARNIARFLSSNDLPRSRARTRGARKAQPRKVRQRDLRRPINEIRFKKRSCGHEQELWTRHFSIF